MPPCTIGNPICAHASTTLLVHPPRCDLHILIFPGTPKWPKSSHAIMNNATMSNLGSSKAKCINKRELSPYNYLSIRTLGDNASRAQCVAPYATTYHQVSMYSTTCHYALQRIPIHHRIAQDTTGPSCIILYHDYATIPDTSCVYQCDGSFFSCSKTHPNMLQQTTMHLCAPL